MLCACLKSLSSFPLLPPSLLPDRKYREIRHNSSDALRYIIWDDLTCALNSAGCTGCVLVTNKESVEMSSGLEVYILMK